MMHLEEATPPPEQASSAKPEPMEVGGGTERSPIGLYANDRGQNIAHVEEEVIRVSSLPPVIQASFTPPSSPPPTAGTTNPTYETPLVLLSFQKRAQFMPEPEISEPLPLLTSLFPRSTRTPDYEGVFTQRGVRPSAKGLLEHLCSPTEPSNPRSSAVALS